MAVLGCKFFDVENVFVVSFFKANRAFSYNKILADRKTKNIILKF